VHLAIRYSHLRGRNEVVSSRYFVPSKTQRRRGRDALHRFVGNERLDGDDKRPWQHRRRLGELARDLDSRTVRSAFESATCSHRISLSLFLYFSFLSFSISRCALHREHAHTYGDIRASVRQKQTYRSPRDGTLLTWPCALGRTLSSFPSRFRYSASSFFPSPLQRGKKEA